MLNLFICTFYRYDDRNLFILVFVSRFTFRWTELEMNYVIWDILFYCFFTKFMHQNVWQ